MSGWRSGSGSIGVGMCRGGWTAGSAPLVARVSFGLPQAISLSNAVSRV